MTGKSLTTKDLTEYLEFVVNKHTAKIRDELAIIDDNEVGPKHMAPNLVVTTSYPDLQAIRKLAPTIAGYMFVPAAIDTDENLVLEARSKVAKSVRDIEYEFRGKTVYLYSLEFFPGIPRYHELSEDLTQTVERDEPHVPESQWKVRYAVV